MSKTIRKRDLVNAIAAEQGEFTTQAMVAEVVEKVMEKITQALASGDTVVFRGFGTFKPQVHKAKVGRNPKAPETPVVIPERIVPKFTPSKLLNKRVNR